MFDLAIGSDVVPELITMWAAARDGWRPPHMIDDDLYAKARNAEPGAERAFIGFGCSFGGKWFGGRARGGYNADGTPRNHAAESARAVVRVSEAMKGAVLISRDYRDHWVDSGTVVYADPPYAGTSGYEAAGSFDTAEFWKTMDSWHDIGALVIVSEYSAPDNWSPVWEKAHRQSLQHGRDGRPQTVERVWMRK